MTRKEERELKKLNNPIKDLLKVTNSYFKRLIPIMNNVKDKRHKSYITYRSSELLYPMLMANVMTVGNMRGIKHYFNNDICIENFSKILGNEDLKELPHHDTINDFLKGLDSKELEKIRKYMINQLLDKRSFEDYRLNNKYWIIAIDGTGIHSFKERHCEHCLTRTTENKETGEKTTIYYHSVLEAKLILGDFVFSIGTEFIENEKENISKQDCEINAFIRLAKKIKKDYKRLPICIIGDALYATEGVRNICKNNKWEYIIRYKKGRSINIFEEYTMVKGIEKNSKNVIEKDQDQKVKKEYEWVNDIAYKDEKINVIELTEKIEEKKTKHFMYISSIKANIKNVERIIKTGRYRWKIENEGFNVQKNHGFELEHLFCHNYNAMKNHYLLLQLAHIIRQIYDKSSKVAKKLKLSIKKESERLLISLASIHLTSEELFIIHSTKYQLRFE